MRSAHRDIVSGAFLLLLAIGLHLAARAIPAKFPIGVDSGFFPEVVSAALGLFALVILVQGVRSRTRNGRESAEGTEVPEEEVRLSGGVTGVVGAGVVRAGGVLALIALYGAGLAAVGFLPATLVFLTLLIYLLAPPEAYRPETCHPETCHPETHHPETRRSAARRLTAAVAVSLPTTLVVYAVFTYGFAVLLPSGGIW